MKFLYPLAGDIFGGSEQLFNDFFSMMKNLGFEQVAVIFEENEKLKKILSENEVYFTVLNKGNERSIKKQLKALIAELAPDIVLSFNRAAAAFVPLGEFINMLAVSDFYDMNGTSNIDYFLAASEDIAAHILGFGISSLRVRSLPPIVNETAIKKLNRRDLYIPEKAPLILSSGHLTSGSGFDILFKALDYLSDFYVVIEGDGEGRDELEAYAQKVGVKPRTRFLGYRSDKKSLAAFCDICVCPDKDDTVGRSVLEGFCYKIPVIAVNSYAAHRLVRPEENGLLVRVDDAFELSEKVKRLSRDANFAARLTENAYADYQEKYAYSKVIVKYKNFFESIKKESVDKEYFLKT